jgi:hypothetical protein
MNTDFWVWALKHVIPYIRFTMYYPTLRGAKYHGGYGCLKAGHILLTNDSKKLTSLLIPGEFSHAALCVANAARDVKDPWSRGAYEIAEMTHTNYTKSYFFDLCKEADRVVILECTDWDEDYINAVTAKCREFEDAAYDVKFELGVKTLYCSELVYQSDFEHRLKINLEDLAGLGRQYLSPDGIYKAKNVRVVWDSGAND